MYAAEYADPTEVYTDGYLFGETDFGIDVRHPHFQAYLDQVCERRVKILEQVTGRPGSLLDVGCGTGEFAAAAKRRGWTVQGVEPEKTGAEMTRGRGINVHVGPLEDSGLPEHSWDVVSAFHVLEHLPDSRAFLKTLARWVRPGGHIVVEMPNYRSLVRRKSGADWVHLRPLEHIVYHQPATLREALSRAGLNVVAIRTPTWVTPPQSMDEALTDLARPPLGNLLRPFSQEVDRYGDIVTVPRRAAWPILRSLERLYDRLGVGMVVLGIARVPDSA